MGNCTDINQSTYKLKHKPNKIPQKKLQYLTIASLNYSSILKSPFQFFSNDLFDQQTQISSKFKQLAPQYTVLDFETLDKWPIGNIDKQLQNRYSPLYSVKCGISVDNLLENSNEFADHWMQQYKQITKLIPQSKITWGQDEIETAILFDLICYHSIIAYIFKLPFIKPSQIDTYIDQELTTQDSKVYKNFMNKFFKKQFLNEETKIRKTLTAMQKNDLDILFLQQADANILKAIQKIYPDIRIAQLPHSKCDSAIIINQRTFPGLLNLAHQNRVLLQNQRKIHKKSDRKQIIQFSQQQIKNLNLNQKTIVQVVYNFILISSHLTSKKKPTRQQKSNRQQIQQLRTMLLKLKQVYSDFQIICGIDANSYIPNDYIPGFDIFPQSPSFYTTNKTRTFLQPQINKAQKQDKGKEARDFIISTIKLRNPLITTIGGKKSDSIKFLPFSDHPYDHFFIKASVRRQGQQVFNLKQAHSQVLEQDDDL